MKYHLETLYERTHKTMKELSAIPGLIDDDSPREHRLLQALCREQNAMVSERFHDHLLNYDNGLISAIELLDKLIEVAHKP